MAARFAILLIVSGLCLGLVACSGKHASGRGSGAEEAEDGAPRKQADEDVATGVYVTLKCNGSMYAGTVASVTMGKTDRPELHTIRESGEIRLRVTRTISGPPHQEMTIPYWWLREEARRGGAVTADWVGKSPWPARPRVGDRVLLLLGDEDDAKRTRSELPVVHRWEVGPDDPLVEGFALAVRFLDAKGAAAQDELFRQLCESTFQNMRSFALDAAFHYTGKDKVGWDCTGYGEGYDPARQSRLALLYLKHAVPQISPDERLRVTGSFAVWFEHHLKGVTDELKAAFEDWYLKELAARDDMRRPEMALEGLTRIEEANGVPTIVGLFKKAGRAGLEERLHDCVRSPNERVAKLAKELLARLNLPDEKRP